MTQYYRAVNFDKEERLETYGDGTIISNMWLRTRFSNQLNRLLLNRWRGDHVVILGDLTETGVSKKLISYEKIFAKNHKTLYHATNVFRKVNDFNYEECNYEYIYDYENMTYGFLKDMEVDGYISGPDDRQIPVCVNPIILLLNGAKSIGSGNYEGNNKRMLGSLIADYDKNVMAYIGNEIEDIEDYEADNFIYNQFWISKRQYQ